MVHEVAELGGEWRRVGIEVQEDEALPRLQADRRQPEPVEAEVVEVLGVLRADQRAVEIVDPGVVRALEPDDLAARLLGDGRAAMPADVEERAQREVTTAHHDDVLAVELDEGIGARVRDVHLAGDHDPVGPQDVLALPVEDRGVVIGALRQQRGGAVLATDGRDLVGGDGRRGARGRGHEWNLRSGARPIRAPMRQPSGMAFLGSMNGIAALRAGHWPPSGATISSGVPGSARSIGSHT